MRCYIRVIKIVRIVEIVATGFILALCTDIPRAEIILQRFISATPVRAHKAAHKASHVNEDMQQIHIPMEQKKRATKCPNMPCCM